MGEDAEMNESLYEITMRYQEALDGLEVDENGEILNIESLEEMQGLVQEKTEAVALYIKGLKSMAEAIAEEERILKERRDAKLKRAESLTKYLGNMMLINGLTTFETPKVGMRFRKSEAVVITDETKLPSEFLVENTTYRPDKAALKKAIKGGQDIPGAVLEERENLQIK